MGDRGFCNLVERSSRFTHKRKSTDHWCKECYLNL